jgi:hypothetical protein
MRVRFIISMFRDEILEVSLQKVMPQTANLLKWVFPSFGREYRLTPSSDISHRCHLAWESLPAHLRYTPHCWGNKYPTAVCLLLIVSYLAYLYNDFLIQRLLAGKKNPRGSPALLSVSAEILSSVLTIGAQREQMVDIRPDFTWTVSFPPFFLTTSCLNVINGLARN